MIVLGKSTAKPTERSYGKGVGNFRGIVRFWKGWFEMKNGGTIPPVVARIFFGRQDLTFDKGGKCDSVFRGIVRFWKGWFGMKNGGTIPPVVARIFSGDSTSPLTRDGHGCPKLNAQSFARMRNRQSVHMARMWCGARVCCPFAMVVKAAIFGATGGNPSVLTAEKFAA